MNPLLRLIRRGFRRFRAFLPALALAVLSPCLLRAHDPSPAWWTQRGVKGTAAADNYAAINQGQLKNLFSAAVMEVQARLPGGASVELLQLLAQWAVPTEATDDYAAVNHGQLKALAKPLFDRLIAAGFATGYPWQANGTLSPDNYAMSNNGQAKNLFSFNLTLDTDSNGLPDWWELKHFGQATGTNPNALAPAGNGLTLRQCLQLGVNPVAADSDGDGVPDSLDAYALDAALSQLPALAQGDVTPPTIILLKPLGAVLGP
jgi:hypothetical protein